MGIKAIIKSLESTRDELCKICVYSDAEGIICKKKICLLCHKECLTIDINKLKKIADNHTNGK